MIAMALDARTIPAPAMRHYDVLAIGAGNAGLAAANIARDAGMSVGVVEKRDVGGTCALRGCVPKKVLVAAAQLLHQISLAPAHYIAVGPVRLDWGKLIARERGFVAGVPESFEKHLAMRGIDLVRGPARFIGPNQVAVNGSVLEATKIVIATGSKPRTLSIPGAQHLVTSEDILTMAELPESLVFIGGGVVALEFSHVFARAGCKVTILEAANRLLPGMDEDAVAVVHAESDRIGIEIVTGVSVESIETQGNLLVVHAQVGGQARRFAGEKIANGAGRIADLDELDLAAGGIDHDGTKISVDAYLRSRSNSAVYVAGDSLWSSPQLSPLATYEGRLVGENIVAGDRLSPEYASVPANVYTVPALASVGMTEAAAKATGQDYIVKSNDMREWRSARTYAETAAFSKIIVEKGSGRILGAHLVGHGAEEVIHLFAFAMKHGVNAEALAATIYGYPTFASDIKHMI
jgi:glutathione reductase (NADPH)